ncbi:hypothetical protein CHLRE_02g089608v5 [Chlamydomonas reinhardtii]|uniref:Regulator of telomere elongation helicase 1 homolog n=1 Tax=Chlamydomonas reinhardtii TaxID=3055 RepID=A0A2K3E158_CHLRE|nr:uncharacterized protein CHLRE_02g089608v5 [Chlamydomonas reinhardtii]PNW86513.1 hypothetical protein CHLRE_02g089608v5 [Chlamydomonas reinhardtii]
MEQLSGAPAVPAKPERKIHTLDIAGIPVEFPFDPYPCQRDFMESVIKALQQGKNALLESPTGTGKTLCLLCSTLAWRESLKPATPDPHAAAAAALAAQAGLGGFGALSAVGVPGGAVGGGAAGAAAAMAAAVAAAGGAGMGGVGMGAAGGGGGGAGGGAGKPDLPVIIYSSRTHSQLAQVMKELRNCSYKDRVRSSVLSSRQQTCLHPAASKLSGGAANQACKALTSARKCSWHNSLKFGKYRNAAGSLVGPVPDIEELVAVGKAHGVCPFYLGRDAGKEADIVFLPYNYLLDPGTRRTMADSINWSNAVVIFDEAHNVESVSSDSCSFDITAKQLTDAMLEAKRCKEACLERVERGMTAMVDVPAPGEAAGGAGPTDYRRMAADIDLLLMVLKNLENALHKVSAGLPPPPSHGGGGDGGGLTRPGSFLFEFLGMVGITAHSLSALNATIDSASDVLAAAEVEAGRTNAKVSTVALQHLQSCLNLAFSTLEPLSDRPGAPPAHRGFRVHVHLQRSWGADKLPAPTLSYWCFIPGMAFRRLAALRLRSFLLTSGTLSPMDSFAGELQIPFPVRLENPHIIAPSQVWVGVLPFGPSGTPLNSTYASRDSVAYKDELGNALVNVARTVPDGLLVFFASYAAMDSAINHWKQNGGAGGVGSTWERIVRHKAPVVEPRESAAFGAAIEEFRSRLDDTATQGAVFFAVCRGKVSEGLDFSDRAGRAVVVTGIPYAVKNDPKVRLKRDVLDEEARGGGSASSLLGEGVSGLTGEAWYTNTAMRAVNQAMGRVIRHRWDYGAILLADDRFRNPNTQKNMSRWVREHVNVYEHFGKALGSLTKFFKDKQGFQAPGKSLPGRATSLSAFETVAGAAATSSAAAAALAGAGGGGGGGGRSLMDSVPAAIDVSGIGALAAKGLGGGGGSSSSSGAAAAAKAGGGAKKPAGGLLGLLKSAPAAADAGAVDAPVAIGGGGGAAAAAPTDPLNQSQGQGHGRHQPQPQHPHQMGLAAALGAVGGGGGGAGGSSSQASQAGAPPGLPRPFSAAAGGGGGGSSYGGGAAVGFMGPPTSRPVNMLALVSGSGGGGGGGGGGSGPGCSGFGGGGFASGGGGGGGGEVVVGPHHRLAEHKRRAAEVAEGTGPGFASSQGLDLDSTQGGGGGGGHPGRTASGLTRLVLHPVQLQPPAAASNAAATAAGGDGGSGAAAARDAAAKPGQGGTAGAAGSGEGDAAAASTASHAATASGPAGSGAGDGAATAGGGGAKADPRAFMAQLKSDLSAAAFKSFQCLMSEYKTSKNLTAFVDGAVALLRPPATAHLLRGVAAFMPRDQRDWFGRVTEVHVRAAAAEGGGGGAGGGSGGSGGSGVAAANGKAAASGGGPAAPQGKAAGAAGAAAAPAAPAAGRALGKRPAPSEVAAAACAAVSQAKHGAPAPQQAKASSGAAFAAGAGASNPGLNALQMRAAAGAALNAALASAPGAGGGGSGGGGGGSAAAAQLRAALAAPRSNSGRGGSGAAGPSTSTASGGGGGGAAGPSSGGGGGAAGPSSGGGGGSNGAKPVPAHAARHQQIRSALQQQPPGRGAAAAPALPAGHISAYGSAPVTGAAGAGGGGPQPPPAKRPNLGPSPAYSAPGPSGPAPAGAAGGGGGGGGVLSAAAAATPCSLCGQRPVKNAHEGPCGHVACYNCWLVQLAVHFKCKTCGRGMRQKNLSKKYFM